MNKTKLCTKCNTQHLLKEFYGVDRRYCKYCISQKNIGQIEDGAKRYLERRQLPVFIEAVKQSKIKSGLSWQNFSRQLGLGKNVVYDWISENKQPSQHLQLTISQELTIPYEPFLFIQNDNGEYSCGLRICNSCQTEYLIYKKQNYLTHNCPECIQNRKVKYQKS